MNRLATVLFLLAVGGTTSSRSSRRPRRFIGLDWDSLYAVGYVGTGNVGSETRIYGEFGDYKVDVGVGVETAISWRRYRAFLGALAAKTVVNGVGEADFWSRSVRTADAR